MGSYLTIVNDTDDIFFAIYGPDTLALTLGLESIMKKLSPINQQAMAQVVMQGNVLQTVLQKFSPVFVHQGYHILKPGQRYQSAKLSLSLWQQGTCIRIRIVDSSIVLQEVIMRPIFTGATDNSNNDHSIKWWIQKLGGATEIAKYAFKKGY